MREAAPTRMNLLNLKRRLVWALEGVGLLKSKREALMRDLFRMLGEVTATRDRVDGATRRAFQRLVLAEAFAGRERLISASLAARRDLTVEVEVENIWGVKVPDIKERSFRRPLEEKGFSALGEGMWTLTATDAFEDLIDVIVEVASKEVKLQRLGEEVRATTTRINALEEVVIPSTRRMVDRIASILEEREREELFRLKRFREKRGRMV